MRLSARQLTILEGSLLGDGFLARKKQAHNACFGVLRSSKDLAYLKWQYRVFKSFCRSKFRVEDVWDERTGKAYGRARFRTRSLPPFTDEWERWYSSGRKVIPTDLSLTPLSLAVWFADDGSVRIPTRNGRSYNHRLTLKFATHCFPFEENEFLADLVRELTGVLPKVRKDSSMRKYFLAVDNEQETKEIIRVMDLVFPPLGRKTRLWRRKSADLERKRSVRPTCKFCGSPTFKNGSSNGVQKYMCHECRRQFYV